MMPEYPRRVPEPRSRPSLSLPTRRAIVVGAGSFGTAVAVLLARGGFRTTLQTRTPEQARTLLEDRENRVYLPGVDLPKDLRIEGVEAGLGRADYVFLGVPSTAMARTIAGLTKAGLTGRTAVISLAKGLTPPNGLAPTILLRERFGEGRVACIGGPSPNRSRNRIVGARPLGGVRPLASEMTAVRPVSPAFVSPAIVRAIAVDGTPRKT